MLISSVALASCSIPDCSADQAHNQWSVVGEQRRKVQWVVDGDTFKVCTKPVDHCERNEQISVRVKGLECPESSEEACSHKPEKDCNTRIPMGKKAKADAIRTLRNQMVTLVPSDANGHFEMDPHQRVLAYVKMPNGSDFGLRMIQNGLCYDFGFRYPHDREDQYRDAQKKAGVFPLQPKKK